jgi:hypothetical protein
MGKFRQPINAISINILTTGEELKLNENMISGPLLKNRKLILGRDTRLKLYFTIRNILT